MRHELSKTQKKLLNFFLTNTARFVELASKYLGIFHRANYLFANGKCIVSFYFNSITNFPVFVYKMFPITISIKGMQFMYSDYVRLLKYIGVHVPSENCTFKTLADMLELRRLLFEHLDFAN